MKKTRAVNVVLTSAGALFLFIGVLTSELGLDVMSVFKVLLGVAANVFILSVVAIDVLIGGMSRARIIEREAVASASDPLDAFMQAASDAAPPAD